MTQKQLVQLHYHLRYLEKFRIMQINNSRI
nr:MAG TPA: hypothetical protein [Caudoviricetes sp.]